MSEFDAPLSPRLKNCASNRVPQGTGEQFSHTMGGYRKFLCANGLPFAIAIREDIREQSLALRRVGRLDHGTIHNARVAVNPHVQIFEMLPRMLANGRMLAQKLKVLFLCDDFPRHNVQEIGSKDTFERHRIVPHLEPPIFQG
jgi:hypothetical protein